MSSYNRLRFTRLLKNDTFCKILSLVIAFALWMFTVMVIDNDDVNTIRGVPITIDQSTLDAFNLIVTDGDETTVTVDVSGKRYDIGNLTKEDITVRAVLTSVTEPGTYEIALQAVNVLNNNYNISLVGKTSVEMSFDRVDSAEIAITADIGGLQVPTGYLLGQTEVSPSTITIQGPQLEIDKIEKAVVSATLRGSITRSQSIPAQIVFYDAQGNEVSAARLQTSITSANIIIPVKKILELPLTLSFNNIPRGLDTDQFVAVLSNENITIAAPESDLIDFEEITLGNIDFKSFDLSEQNVYTFEVALPLGFVNVNNIETVVVEFDNSGISSRTLDLSSFVLTDVPEGYIAEVTTPSLNNVKIVGDSKVLSTLKPEDFVISVNFPNQDVQIGQYEMPVSIWLEKDELAWAVGSYSAVVSVRQAPHLDIG